MSMRKMHQNKSSFPQIQPHVYNIYIHMSGFIDVEQEERIFFRNFIILWELVNRQQEYT